MSETSLKKLRKTALSLPILPGIYIFLNSKSRVLYIGKAKELRKRVLSYFKDGGDGRSQIPALMSQATQLQFIVTNSEKEALFLENNLIKEKKPPYNVFLKDDKTFKTICITTKHPFPGIKVLRKYTPEVKNKYFGPYIQAREVNIASNELIKLFKIRDCSDSEFQRRKKACLKYQMQTCSAPCVSYISKIDYQKQIDNAVQYLKGNQTSLLKKIEKEVESLSQNLRYEEAGQKLKVLQSLKQIIQSQSQVAGFKKDSDAVGVYFGIENITFQIFIIRSGKIISSDVKYLEIGLEEKVETLSRFLQQYYLKSNRTPSEIWLPFDPANKSILEQLLSEDKESSVKIIVPKKGSKYQTTILACENARLKADEKSNKSKKNNLIKKAFNDVFKLSRAPQTIECFDISHHGGNDCVGSKICFKDFEPSKENYRQYHIKISPGQDDYSSMFEILNRRLKRGLKEKDLPGFILIDGGKGHLLVAEKALKRFNLKIPTAGIVKENHSKNSFDQIFIPGRKNSLPLKRGNIVLLQLMRIRDEAHRFALKFHKIKQTKRIIKD